MTIQQLQYILEVNRTRSITQAAKNLYVTQAGISSAISSLEDELGFQIFSRSWQGAIPTERGAKVIIGDSPGGLYNAVALNRIYAVTGMKDVAAAGAVAIMMMPRNNPVQKIAAKTAR